ncbi:M23 family metallopeptidase [Tissierella sp.]|uniref:M23 family metallopeptidase n=1 Tax=Tissierella sp. TaxID=41274 RepID=UPI00285A4B3F|nr:M23 family metallopeptidase [Tissierella sp.]MDR7854985.1 M23 family metallopeptidase [Tissierella sp.]
MINSPKPTGIGLDDLKKQISKLKSYGKKIKLKKIDLKKFDFKINNINTNTKKLILRSALVLLMITSIIALSITGYESYQASLEAFEVYLGEYKIGTVRQQEDVIKIMEDLETELSNTYDMDIVFREDLKFIETKIKDEFISSKEEIRDEVNAKTSFLVQGYVLKVNDVEIGALKTKEEIDNIIKRIEEPYREMIKEDSNIKEVKIVEKVEIVKENMPLYKIGDAEELYNHLLTSSEEIRIHTVEVGESLWTISKIYGLSVDELTAANQDKNPDKLQIGDEVKLVVPKSILTVATVAQVEYMENVKYETEYEYNDNMYKNEKKTKVAGASGLSKIVANEIKHNGILVEKEIVSAEVLEEPVTQIIIKGTKEVPKTAATGAFLMPTRGRISSRYGMRSGRMHTGLDIAAKKGTAINAADGGKVVYVGYKGAYGNMVEIDHGNGFKTRYAHLSKILVSVGTKVYKGQHIGNMGSTGRSTGSHLHFEVLKNGKSQNPGNYVK